MNVYNFIKLATALGCEIIFCRRKENEPVIVTIAFRGPIVKTYTYTLLKEDADIDYNLWRQLLEKAKEVTGEKQHDKE